ncbi:MAG TPA: phosphatidate cytidylyltransferase [Porticoccaceae bacterium]|jgi:phosphatidate cytidylyltransferase|nr:phosphatidate cytidylyltransferase [Porticoccaceae bacterium]
MFKQRVITAVILVVAFLALLLNLSAVEFSLVIGLLVIVAGWEWTNLMKIGSGAGKAGYLLLLGLSLAAASYFLGLFTEFDQDSARQMSLAAVALWAVIFLWIQGYPSSAILWSARPILGLLGLLLLTSTWAAVASVLDYEYGRWLLVLGIAIVALADVGGYIAGNLFGKRKLAPIVSPGKTWEGFAGGILFQLLLIAGLAAVFPQLAVSSLFILIIPVALYSVLGDLFESMIKRQSGVKDSSQLLPGHGGLLDRIDGIMAALPLFALLLSLTSPF